MRLQVLPSEVRLVWQWLPQGERPSMSPLPHAKVGTIHLLKLTARAAYRATGDVLKGRLQQIGQVFIVDHPSKLFVAHHFEGARLEPEAEEILLPTLARVFSAVVLLWVMYTSRAAVREYLQMYGLSGEQKISKLIATYAQTRVAIWIRRPSAFIVTHDLVPTVFFAALSAAHADLPMWLILQDHADGRQYPFTARGAVGFQPHDACFVRPQPRLFLRYQASERWKRPQVARALVLASHPEFASDAEQMILLLVGHLLNADVFDSVAVRPHPAHAFDASQLPTGVKVSLPSTPLHRDVLQSICVFFVAPSSAMNTVRSVGAPMCWVNLDDLRRSADVLPHSVSKFLQTGKSNVKEISRPPCDCKSHPRVLEFGERFDLLDLVV